MGVRDSQTARSSSGRNGRHRRMWALGVAAALVVAGSACGDDDSSADGGASVGPSGSQGDLGDTEAGPSGVVRSAPIVSLITLDPHNFIGGGLSWLTPVYEPLFRQIAGEEEIQPLLATGYEIDGLDVTMTLREDVTFTDGEPFNAEVVKANLERGKEIGVRPEFAPIDSVTVVDEYTVEVTLASPTPGFIADMATVPGLMISPTALDDPELDRHPVGTGPWMYNDAESREGDVHVYTLNDDYWNPEAQGVERIEIYDMPDQQARTNALKTGQIDFAAVDGPASEEVAADPSLGLITGEHAVTFGVPILDREGTVVPALGEPEVRQAMSLAIDREAFVDVVHFGRAVPNLQPAPPGHWAHNDALDDQITYDPDRARELLAEAGYPDGFSFTIPSIPSFSSQIEVLGEFWRDIGIDLTIEPLEPGTLAGRSRTTDFPVTMLNWVTGADMSLYVPTYLSEDATFNPFHAEPDARILELDAEGAATTELAERAPAYQEMAAIIADELPVIYVTSVEAVLGSTAELADNPTVTFAAGQTGLIWHGLRISE